MSTTTPIKSAATGGRILRDWISGGLASGNVSVGAALDVSGLWAGLATIQLVRGSGTAFAAGWPNVRIEASALASGSDNWVSLFEYQMASGASIANTTLAAAVSAGATSLTVAAATNLAAGDLLALATASYSACEVARVKSVSGTTLTLEEPLTNAYASGDAVRDQAETALALLDLAPVLRLRAVVDNANSGQTMNARVLLSTLDSLSTL
mgnify:CR=1 FL=1